MAGLTPEALREQYQNGLVEAYVHDEEHMQQNEPGLFQSDFSDAMDQPDRDTFLWRYLTDVIGEWWPQAQQRGTCVGQGYKLLCDIAMAVNSKILGTEFPGRAAVAGIYPLSRVEIAGRPGRWDGSNGSWASKALVEYGVPLLKHINLPEDARWDDEELAVKYANRRDGIPEEFEDQAKEMPFTGRKRITDPDECAKAIQSGNPVAVCSNYWATGVRDSQGFSKLRKHNGGHCQVNIAVRYDPWGIFQLNSWGWRWGGGPKGIEDEPDGGVWLSKDDVYKQLNDQGDNYTMINLTGTDPLPEDEVVF